MSHQSPDKNQILEQLSRILRSQVFRNSEMLRNFLSFIVQEAIKENGISLKQYSIAIHAFGRKDDFDATADPIVRIQASRLRRNLEQYYQEDGENDPILISLPKGSYSPNIETRKNKKERPTSKAKSDAPHHSLAVFPIKNLSANQDKQYIIDGFNEELLLELSRYKDLDVIRIEDTSNESAKKSYAGFSLEGSLRFGRDTVKISFHVTDNIKSVIFWSYQEKFNLEDCDLISVQEKVATSVAQQIAGISGVISEKLYLESNWESTHDLDAYTVYMHFYRYNKNPTEKNANDLLEKISHLIEQKPDFAPGWAVLCNLYTDAYMFGLDRSHLEQGLSFGRKAIDLQPNNQVCQAYYAYALMINGQVKEAIHRFEIALKLNPNAPYYAGAIGWAYCMIDKLSEGYELIRNSMRVDFQYPKWFHMGTFLYYLDRKEYDKALIEVNQLDKPELYWSHLIKLVANQKLALTKQATIHLQDLMEIKPDFFDRPMAFIQALIKSKSLSDEIYNTMQSVVKASKIAIPST
jgi:adenylate cyclase